ncbi:spore germination protein GerPE [Gottfriedia sp. S16(2024)]|uniref:spore germination protein GerPE n=1 Tax=Gottfriedia sp. S16(2024) TaxID=3162883 RepID=UPI003D24AD05
MFKIDPRFRLAALESYNVNTVLFSSVLQFGDALSMSAESNALALQEQGNVLTEPGKDVFETYPLYKVMPKHLPYVPNVKLNRVNLNPTIQVGSVNYNGISSASASIIGSIYNAFMLSRVHQIRHFITPPTLHYQTPGVHTQPTFAQLMQPLMSQPMQAVQSDVLMQPTTPSQIAVPTATVAAHPVAPVPAVHVPVVPAVPAVAGRLTESKKPPLSD